jgi:hypothetical protein
MQGKGSSEPSTPGNYESSKDSSDKAKGSYGGYVPNYPKKWVMHRHELWMTSEVYINEKEKHIKII